MNRFDFEIAGDVEHALTLGQKPHSAYVGGGTTLLDLMKLGVCAPTLLVDVNHAGMGQIALSPNGSLTIGASVTMAHIARHAAVREHFPMLRQALLAGATPQLRNAATLGGNLLQRPRCFYFREPGFRCNKKLSGSGCDALTGGNETHAIFAGGDTCIAVHPSDLATALTCLDAVLHIRSANESRRLPISQFFVAAEMDSTRETVLQPGELIVSVDIPAAPHAQGAAYFKIPPAGGFAVVSAAVALEIKDQTVVGARVVLGGVAHTPWRAHYAEARVLQREAIDRTWREAAAAEFSQARGRGDNDYKIALGREVLTNAFAHAAAAVHA